MRLKNIVIVVEDIERSIAFYKELFGLEVLRDFGENVILSEGLVLQSRKVWEQMVKGTVWYGGKSTELYFETYDLEAFQEKLDESDYSINYLNRLTIYEWGQKCIRFYDPDKHLIEIGETGI